MGCPEPECAAAYAELRAKHAAEENDAEYERYKRQQEARERWKRDQLEATFAGELTPAQLARVERIESGIMSRDELSQLPKPRALIRGLLFFDSLSWVAGESGSYKSFITLDMAARFADPDLDYHGLPMQHGKALVVVGEGNSAYISRVQAWEEYHGRPWPDDAKFHNGAIQLGDPDSVAALREVISKGDYGLVIFDTQAMMTVGVDENQAVEMGRIMAVLHALREATTACILTVHHFGKRTEDMRGSGAIYAAATTVIVTTRDGNSKTVSLSTLHEDKGKQKDAKERKYPDFVMQDIKLQDPDDDGDDRWSLVVTAPAGADGERATEDLRLTGKHDAPILRVLLEFPAFGASPTELAAALADGGHTIDKSTVRKRVEALRKADFLMGAKTALKVSPKGRRALDFLDQNHRQSDDNAPF
jgi:hypothetical protein